MSHSKISNKIKLDTFGKIIEGDDSGGFVKIEKVPESRTGAFYIFQCSERTFTSQPVYDAWVEDMESLNQFFLDSKWKVDWDI